MSKIANLEAKTLRNLDLNSSIDVTSGALKLTQSLIQEVTVSNAAYAFRITQKSARIYTITRVLPNKLTDRGVYFDTIKKSQIQKAMKQANFVKTEAARKLNMSPRTLRRKIAEFNLSY